VTRQELGEKELVETKIRSSDTSNGISTINTIGEPDRVQFQVRNLSNAGLFVADSQGALEHASMRVRFECIRLSSHYMCNLDQISAREIHSFEDYECLRAHFEKNGDRNTLKPEMVDPLAWKHAGEGFGGVSLKGKLIFNSKDADQVFKLHLEPLQMEQSCRFQRAFGGDRFLYLSVPSLTYSKLPSHLKRQMNNIQSGYKELLRMEKRFLGCKWETFLIERKQRNKLERFFNKDKFGGHALVLFATQVSARRSISKSPHGEDVRDCFAGR
jgi:hypothetical protein